MRGGYKYLNGKIDGNSGFRAASYPLVLPDGTFVRFGAPHLPANGKVVDDCNIVRGMTPALKSICAEIFIDINGMQNPNTFGRDVFIFYWTKNGLIPVGSQEEHSHVTFSTCSKNVANSSGYGCTAWVLVNENMDYLHCDGLSWSGKKTCK